MSTWPARDRIWNWQTSSLWRIDCESRCGRSALVAVDCVPDRNRADMLAGRAFLVLGWVKHVTKWHCPRCWTRLVARMPNDPTVETTMWARHRYLKLDVQEAA